MCILLTKNNLFISILFRLGGVHFYNFLNSKFTYQITKKQKRILKLSEDYAKHWKYMSVQKEVPQNCFFLKRLMSILQTNTISCKKFPTFVSCRKKERDLSSVL